MQLDDVRVLAQRLPQMTPGERSALREMVSSDERECTRMSALLYRAACEARIPWRASAAVRRYAQWLDELQRLPAGPAARAACADAALAHPEHPVRAFAAAAFARPPVQIIPSIIAGIRILYRLRSGRGGTRAVLRRAARANAVVYRLATTARNVFRQWFPPPLPPETRRIVARYPALREFVSRGRREAGRTAAFRRLLATDFLPDYVNGELEHLTRGNGSAWRANDYLYNLQIVRTHEFLLRFNFLDGKLPSEIRSGQHDTIVSPVGGSIEIRRYGVPAVLQSGSFDPDARLVELDSVTIAPGEIAVLRAGVEAHAVLPQTGTPGILTLQDNRSEPVTWRFDPASLRCVGAVSNDPTTARLRETLELAGALNMRTIVPAARTLLDHPSHLVRWSAVRAVSTLSKKDATELLRRAARDRHPQLRRAAQRLLQEKA